MRGTRFGIGVDPSATGCCTQGAEGYQLTWMDAKVDDWVVTPRRGKAVEINALWFNALKLMERWAEEHGDPAAEYRERAEQAGRSFNERFWYAGPRLSLRHRRRRQRRRDQRREVPARIRCWPSRCRTRCWRASAGSR